MDRRLIIVTTLLVLTLAPMVSAVVNPDTLTVLGTSRRTESSAKTVDAIAGNVTQLDISVLQTTSNWQGYYGNISGVITLDDASGNTFYNWSVATAQGEVYAARVASPDWTAVGCANAGNITAEETALGHTASATDSVSNTFSSTSHPAFNVSTSSISANSCPSTNAFINSGQSSTNFYQVLLADDLSDIIYATILDDNTVGFDGGTYDFELLVGENGNGNTATTTYYFFVELE